jgi:DNA helicase-2/ATP-dependent DNA helicase PcrA
VSFVDGLNERQREAVLHGDGPLVIFAGAGSGKTRVITHRVAQLVAERQVKPWRILAVTFTNKAAAEMRQRLESLVPGGGRDLWVGTFHATCSRLLRRYAELASVRKDFVIYDDSDQRAMVTRIVRDMGLDDRRYHPRQVAGMINRAKNEANGPDTFEARDEFERTVQRIYETYEARMATSGALDFGDLIFRLVDAMTKNPALLYELQTKFSHVLVDEYQDTNRVQYLLLRGLCERHRNLCVVGDDDQSIYRFRGADRRNILEFTRQFAGAHVVKLEQNYRSTQRILRVANAVVSRNVEREPKTLWTDNESGSKITLLACGDERDEAHMLVKLVQMLLEAGHARRELALLYRTHAQSRVIEEALRFADMPYRVVGGLRFYDRAEVKDLLCYLRAVHNPDDDVSLLRIINTPARGIGKTTIERLLDTAATSGKSVWSALTDIEADPAQSSAARKSLLRFRELIEMLRQMVSEGHGPADLARSVLEQTGYAQTLKDEDSVEADARLENLQEVLGSMVEFEREAEEPTLTAFLELVTLQTDADRGDDGDSITLMTVHAAKGLEFPAVMVAGLEEETFPHRGLSPDDDPDDLEEERRLAYVAFTRAKQRLFLSYAKTRRVYGEVRFRQPSRFLDEMPQDELERVGAQRPEQRWSRGPGFAGTAQAHRGGAFGGAAPAHRGGASVASRPPPAFSSRPFPVAASPAEERVPGDSHVDRLEASDQEGVELHLGMRVRHQKFGVGQVRALTPGSPPRVTVSFPGWGDKTLVSSYLEPA